MEYKKLAEEDSTTFAPSKDITYAWYRLSNKDDDIANGTLVGDDETYKLTGSDKGNYIKLVVTYNGKTFENITSLITRTSSSSSSSSSTSNSSNSSSSNSSSNNASNVIVTSNTNGATTVILNASGDGTIKLLDKNGQPSAGWQQVNGTWYLANAAGIAQTGWQQVNGKWYLLASSGAMQTGWQKVDSKWYYLYSDGSMASDTIIDGYRVDASGAWV